MEVLEYLSPIAFESRVGAVSVAFTNWPSGEDFGGVCVRPGYCGYGT